MKTCKEKALEWGISDRSVNYLCKQGKIPGAQKVNKAWQIPEDAQKPKDGRVTSGKYQQQKSKSLKSLPIGISEFIRPKSQ